VSESQKKYLTTPELRERWGVSHMFLERRLNEPGFPKPVKLGSTPLAHRRWPLDQVEAYERDCTVRPAPLNAKRIQSVNRPRSTPKRRRRARS
jgi:predicted DNA-binding transcriptional regulator AlpA